MEKHSERRTHISRRQGVAQAVSQKRMATASSFHFEDNRPETAIQRKMLDAIQGYQPIQKKENNTGLPDNLKTGMENLSGQSLDDVTVHYNSDKPAQLQAHAYAQGTDIHLASGQEKHLPHEAWHVVQQKQGRVQPTTQLQEKVNINDDENLEREADLMGDKSIQMKASVNIQRTIAKTLQDPSISSLPNTPIVQGLWVIKNGKKVWQEKKPSGSKYRTSGELKWKSWWKPREYNERHDVYEQNPEATEIDDIKDTNNPNLFIDKKFVDQDVLNTIGQKNGVSTLEFRSCIFDDDISSAPLGNLDGLRYLSFNNPNTFSFSDNMGGIASIDSLTTLKLIRCDFLHNPMAYNNLGAMTQLDYLDLTRTLTKEKSLGEEGEPKIVNNRNIRQVVKIDDAIVIALKNLIKHLSFLNIEYCTALSHKQIETLVDEGHTNGCLVRNSEGIEPSPEAQYVESLSRMH